MDPPAPFWVAQLPHHRDEMAARDYTENHLSGRRTADPGTAVPRRGRRPRRLCGAPRAGARHGEQPARGRRHGRRAAGPRRTRATGHRAARPAAGEAAPGRADRGEPSGRLPASRGRDGRLRHRVGGDSKRRCPACCETPGSRMRRCSCHLPPSASRGAAPRARSLRSSRWPNVAVRVRRPRTPGSCATRCADQEPGPIYRGLGSMGLVAVSRIG